MINLLRLVVQYGVAVKVMWHRKITLFLTMREYRKSIQISRKDVRTNELRAMQCATQIQRLIAHKQATDNKRAYQMYEDEINALHTLAGHYRGIADYHKRRIDTIQRVVEDIEKDDAM